MRLFKKRNFDTPRRRSGDVDVGKTTSRHIFRRGRTLIGSTSNTLDSVNIDTKTDLQSPRTHSHRLAIQRRKVASILLITLLASAVMWALVSHLTATVLVSVADPSISKPLDKTKYEKVIQDYLDINPMARLTFLLDQTALDAYVSNKMPEVVAAKQGASIGLGKTNFSVIMREPVAGWQINGKQYYVDSNGMAFDQNYYSSIVVQIVDNSGVSLKTGSTAAVSRRFLAFVGRVVHLARSSGYTVTQAALPASTTRELEIRLKDGGYPVKLSIDRSAGEQVEDMVAAIQYFASRGQIPQYIDVRVGGKAFYK